MWKGIRRGEICFLKGLVLTIVLIASSLIFVPTEQYDGEEIVPLMGATGILITEIRDSPDNAEQIELFNRNSIDINVVGWTLVIDGVTVDLTPISMFVRRSHRSVGDPATTAHIKTDITLGDEGGSIILLNKNGDVEDTAYYGQLGRIPDPIQSESVERIRVSTYVYSDQWTRAKYPSFNYFNDAFPNINNPLIILNEVFFNAANPDERFIEVYFKGFGSFDISGYILICDTQYILPSVTLNTTRRSYAVLPSQAPALFNEMDSTGDNVYLTTQYDEFMDMVGWSSLHTQDMSMTRVPDGYGHTTGYNDSSSILAGWQFDQGPTVPWVVIGPGQSQGGDLGAMISYKLFIINVASMAAYVNVEILGTQGWNCELFMADGTTPLQDSPGDVDDLPDVGNLTQNTATMIWAVVEIPSEPPNYDWEVDSIKASIAGYSNANSKTTLTTTINPYIIPTASIDPDTIWVDSSPPDLLPKEATLTLNITGRGVPSSERRPQDTMLMIDSSGSMAQNDPLELRLRAAKHYIDLMSVPDRAAVVDFDWGATLVNGDHLSSDYQQIKSNINTIDSVGATNLYDPIRISNDELINYGNKSHVWVEILLTDGDDTTGHSEAQILSEAQRAADNGITIFTIGLIGSGGVNENLLYKIANRTGGVYMRAQTAYDLEAIYELINQLVTMPNLAGYDEDITDDIPMISIFLPSYINYVPGTSNPIPDYIGTTGGETNLQWNLSKLEINKTWIATLNVTSNLDGFDLYSMVHPESRVSYMRYDTSRANTSFPETFIDVLAAYQGSICGCKWYDVNRNGFKDDNETLIQGFKIEIYNETGFLSRIYTDANGSYCFDKLTDGDYTLREVLPTETDANYTWVQTYPGGDGRWNVSVSGGQIITDINFGNVAEFTGSRTWGYWKTHTGLSSPPRDEAYDTLPGRPLEVDIQTPNGDDSIDSDAEAYWLFNGADTGRSPNCSGDCRSLFRAQLLALHMNVLKFGDMGTSIYLRHGSKYDGWTVQEILNEAVDKLLNGGQGFNFTEFQMTLDDINNNHNYNIGEHVLVLPEPPPFQYP